MGRSSGGSGGGGSWTYIARTTLSAAAASISFSSLPSSYASLAFVGLVRGVNTSLSDILQLELNGDTSGDYAQYAGLSDSGAGGGQPSVNAGNTVGQIAAVMGGSAGVGEYSAVNLIMPGYAVASQYKAVTGTVSAFDGVGSTTNYQVAVACLTARVATAITAAVFSLAGGNLAAGSSLTVYGLQ